MVASAMNSNFGAIQLLGMSAVGGGIQNQQSSDALISLITDIQGRLQDAVIKEEQDKALEIIEELASAPITKDALERTRIGGFVNEIRKLTAQNWPQFSKKCRQLIKKWQELANYRPNSGYGSGSASTEGTPNLVSPAKFGSKHTPPTPVRDSRNKLTPPLVIKRSDLEKCVSLSPSSENVYKTGVAISNGLCSQIKSDINKGAQPLVLKRSKTSGYQLATQNGASPSLHEARKNVNRSTAELLAHLSQNLTSRPPDLQKEEYIVDAKDSITISSVSNSEPGELGASDHIDSSLLPSVKDNTIETQLICNQETTNQEPKKQPQSSAKPLIIQRRFNWHTEYPVFSREIPGTSQKRGPEKRRKLKHMPFCDIGLN